jgi:hypothetical protein
LSANSSGSTNDAISTREATNNGEKSHKSSGALFDASDFVVEVLEKEARDGKS